MQDCFSFYANYRLLDSLNIAAISKSTYYRNQKAYLHPIVFHTWKSEREGILSQLASMEGQLILSGDGRADSPGHCAKFGTYTLIEETINKVIDVQIVQV